MTQAQWACFETFRDRFRGQCERWATDGAWLAGLERAAAEADENPAYPLENPIVYNQALDAVRESDEIRLIVVGDNPGKDEQLDRNRRYLVGQAGKLGEGFFRRNPELGIDFRNNAIILNKTPIHTAKTKQLGHARRNGGARFVALFDETQRWMARETAALQRGIGCELWLVGYGELRPTGLFAAYAEELSARYADGQLSNGARSSALDAIRLYQHFSMNRFSIDLSSQRDPDVTLSENLRRIGIGHRREILGW